MPNCRPCWTPIAWHFETYREHRVTQELNSTRIKNTQSRLNRVASECGFKQLADNPEFAAKLDHRDLERALVFRTLVPTGLRCGELASLTVGSLELDAATPFAVPAADDEKTGTAQRFHCGPILSLNCGHGLLRSGKVSQDRKTSSANCHCSQCQPVCSGL